MRLHQRPQVRPQRLLKWVRQNPLHRQQRLRYSSKAMLLIRQMNSSPHYSRLNRRSSPRSPNHQASLAMRLNQRHQRRKNLKLKSHCMNMNTSYLQFFV